MSSIEDILISAQSGSQQTRNDSLHLLSQELHTNPSNLLSILSQILSSPSKPLLPRQLAGYYLKNAINNSTNDPLLQNLWTFLPVPTKQSLKTSILAVLADESRDLRQVSAQIISSICKFDLPSGQWPEVLKILLMNSLNINPIYKEASIMTLGYICECIDGEVFNKEESDSILTAFFSGLADNEKNFNVMKASLQGVKNSLKFFRANLIDPGERKILLTILIKCCVNPKVEIRRYSMEALCEIGGMYYDYIYDNLIDLGNVTYNAINNDEPSVGILAIEFWNTLGLVEMDRIDQHQIHRNYLSTAAASLTPILLSKIHIFEENDEEWNLHKAAGFALSCLAYTVKDPIVDYTYLYITSNLSSPNTKLMRSAALVFGSILKGPSSESLSHLVKSSMKTLQMLIITQNPVIKNSVAWCFSNIIGNFKDIYEFCPVKELLVTIKHMINDENCIACHGCGALMRLTEYDQFGIRVSREDVNSLFNTLLGIYMKTGDFELNLAVLMALKSVIEKAPKDSIPLISNKINVFLELLQRAPDNLIGAVINTLECVIRRMGSTPIIEHIADEIVRTILNIIKTHPIVFEDGIDAIGSLSWSMNYRFEKYISHIIPILLWGIEDIRASCICKASILCLGDLARSLSLKFTPQIPHFIPKFSAILSDESVSLHVKIETINTIGDFCAIPGAFHKYLQGILQYIDSAAGVCKKRVVEEEDPDLFDAINMLRESILCFYTNLINGLNESNMINSLIGRLEEIVNLCLVLTQECYNSSFNVHFYAIGLLGDIASSFKEACAYVVKSDQVLGYVKSVRQSENFEMREAANHAFIKINQL
jgi:importin subunit beta-1